MMYLFNYNLKVDKNIDRTLTKIFGLGVFVSSLVIKKLGFCKNLNLSLLKQDQIFKLKKLISRLNLISNNVKTLQAISFKKLLKLNLLKAIRKLKGLPVRGQRTKTNSKTSKKIR